MNRLSIIATLVNLVIVCSAAGSLAAENERGAEPRSRDFRFDYGATLENLPPGAKVRVWLPVPRTNEHQKVNPLKRSLPAEGKLTVEPKYGNQILYFQSTAPESGSLTFQTSYDVHRQEVLGLSRGEDDAQLNEQQRKLFLSANSKVPLQGKQLELLDGLTPSSDSWAMARALYDRVDEHVRYDKSQPGYGNGDVLWVCDSRFGNCTDFHSLFISLSRAKGLPARFEIGFPLPPERGEGEIGGYHCWAFFYLDQQGWVPVDISEADKHPEMKEYYFGQITEDRVTFTTGRDITLVPPQEGEPLNFFVYPYVEVNGQPWPKEHTQLTFGYSDR